MLTDQLANGIAARVIERLDSSERNVRWLARKTGINYSTLRNQLFRNRRGLSHEHAILIAEALDVPIGDLDPRTTKALV